ncbi:MAG: hypothetical protein LAQ30_04350 [Acidobacteriia bacterium]|nr:hypothetical protein [Terriglobia bacterium]
MATYLEATNLAQDADFIKRITHAVAKFATYILDEAEATPNHRTRSRWAQSAIINPAGVAQAVAPAVTLDQNVDYGLANTLDADIQTAVENACANLLFT